MNTIQFDPRFAPHVEALVRFFSSRETKTLRARTVCQFVVGKGEGRRWSQSAVNQARVDAWCKENLPIAGWYYYGSHRYVRHTR
jgi:hypothetical protein